MSNNNLVNTALRGATGTGSFVGSTSAVLTTPTLGVASATSLAFSPTTSGVIGTATNDAANAGVVGEVMTANLPLASSISLTTATNANVTSISLTAGDWDIYGNVSFTVVPSTGDVLSINAWMSITSATLPDLSNFNRLELPAAAGGIRTSGLVAPFLRLTLAGTTTVYLSARATFTNDGVGVCGTITARRAR